MKIVILAGGFGSRLSEETNKTPKPMVEIGGKPILWHIMKMYSRYGFNEFIICLGYKGYVIKEWFANYFLHGCDVTIDLKTNNTTVHNNQNEDWKVTLVDTGLKTETGGRIKRIAQYVGDETFMLTYGDGVSNVDIKKLVEFHKNHGKLATLTAVQPVGRFGALNIKEKTVVKFAEKLDNKKVWINGGFFILEPGVFKYIPDDKSIWEKEPLEKITQEEQLMAYHHHGFWKCMDKLIDKKNLEKMWESGNAPWKTWK